MKTRIITALVLLIFFSGGLQAQVKPAVPALPVLEIYYFHPNERCPIDQSIEENLRKLIQSEYAREVKEGTIRFKVVNTDDKTQAKLVSSFDINAQALWFIKQEKGKEIKTDLTEFAFANGLSNVDKFKVGIRDEIAKALKGVK